MLDISLVDPLKFQGSKKKNKEKKQIWIIVEIKITSDASDV